MGIFSIFKKKTTSSELVAAAQKLIDWCGVRLSELEEERQSKMQRQAELWSVMTPTVGLQEDYRKVTQVIAELILKQNALRERKEKLTLTLIDYQDGGDPEALVWLLKLPDPTLYVNFNTPEVKYSKDSNQSSTQE